MKYQITVVLLDNSMAYKGGYPTERKFVYECADKMAALERLQTILARGVSETSAIIVPPQTVFYPAHTIERVFIEPPITDFV